MQIVHFRFCHVSKFLALDCLHYNAVKCTATCNLFTYLVHQNATFQVKNKKTYSANPESKLRPTNPIILTMYSLFSQNTFQRTPNHHFGWTIRHFFLTTARTKYRSENPWPPRSSLLGLHRAASPRIPARSTPGADTAVGGPACWRWETVAYNREAVHSGRSAAVLLQSCKYIIQSINRFFIKSKRTNRPLTSQ